MKKAKSRKKQAIPYDDFWTPDLKRTWEAIEKRREAEKAAFYASAELLAVTQGIDPTDEKAVHAYLIEAMRRYSTACRGGDAPPEARDLLPNNDWRIQWARTDGNELAAAMLYMEAADANNEEATRVSEESAWQEYEAQQEAQKEAAIIAAHERRKAKKRPGRYAHYGNMDGVTYKEAVEILAAANMKKTERQIRRWVAGESTAPNGFPGLSSRTQFVLWARTIDGQTRTGRLIQEHQQYKETVTEASNMRLRGRKTPRGLF